MSTVFDSPRPIQYHPPSHDVLEQFAFSACEELGPEFHDPEVARGFANCLTMVARIAANILNRQGNNQVASHTE